MKKRIYDFEKAIRLIKKNRPKRAMLCIQGHEFATGYTVYKDGEFNIDLTKNPEINGIRGSRIGTPVLELDGEQIECWKYGND